MVESLDIAHARSAWRRDCVPDVENIPTCLILLGVLNVGICINTIRSYTMSDTESVYLSVIKIGVKFIKRKEGALVVE